MITEQPDDDFIDEIERDLLRGGAAGNSHYNQNNGKPARVHAKSNVVVKGGRAWRFGRK